VTKDICPFSGLLAGPNCPPPVQVTYDLESDDKPPTKVCDIHSRPATPRVEPQPAEQRPQQVAPKAAPKKVRRTVTLPICAISGKLATPFCPIVKNVTFDEDRAPTETCTRHGRRPPGP
jgi:hypothetical protein